VSLRIPSSSRSPDHDPHRTVYYLRYLLGRFTGLKHRQLARQIGEIITTGRIRRTLVNKINLLADSPRSIEANRLAPIKAESIFLRRASGCFGTSCGSSSTTRARPGALACRAAHHTALRRLLHVARLVVDYFDYAARPVASACHAARRQLLRASRYLDMSRSSSRGSSSTTSPTPRVRVLRHVERLVARLVIDYFTSAARLGASARRAAHHAARRQLLRLLRASRCLGMSRGSSRGSSRRSSLTTSPTLHIWCLGSSRGSSSTTAPLPHVRVPQHVARIVVDYFAYDARPGASARRAARRRLLPLRRASGCLVTSRGSSSTTPHVQVPRHVAQLVAPLVVDYFASAARPGSSTRCAARRRLLRLRRASGCLGTSRGSSSNTSPTPRVWVPRHIAWLVTQLVVDYFASAAGPGASTRRAARRRLLRRCRASGCLGTSRDSSTTTSPTPHVWVPRHFARLVTQLIVDYFDSAARPGASTHRAGRRRLLRLRRASGCLVMSRGLSRGSSSTTSSRAGSSSTTSPTPRVRLPRHVVRLVTWLVVDYFAYAARLVPRHVARLVT
jgi:hypothetical protein